MKRNPLFSLGAAVLCLALFAGCNSGAASSGEGGSSSASQSQAAVGSSQKAPESSAGSSSAAPQNQAEAALSQQTLEALVSDNFYLMSQVFMGNTLPISQEAQELWDNSVLEEGEGMIQKVMDERFPDYKSLEAAVRGVYSKEEADLLLYNYPYEGDPKYLDQNGELYVNLRHDNPKGYFVNLEEYTVTMGEAADGVCPFTVETTMTEPGETSAAEPYAIEGKALYQDGRWVLEKMIY